LSNKIVLAFLKTWRLWYTYTFHYSYVNIPSPSVINHSSKRTTLLIYLIEFNGTVMKVKHCGK